MIDAVVRDIDEIKLMCSLYEVMISDKVMISYVKTILSVNKDFNKQANDQSHHQTNDRVTILLFIESNIKRHRTRATEGQTFLK